jgi:hypothetical protein
MELARHRLIQWMEANPHVTQTAVGRAVGHHQVWVSRFRGGSQNADVDELEAMAKVYGHTLAELFDLRPNPKEQRLIDAFRRLPDSKRDLGISTLEAMIAEPRKTRRSVER